jgi:Zn-dependent M28 family amino/carboxypeptidase
MKTLKIFVVLLLLVINSFAQSNENPEITIEELKSHIYYLASDELQGRKPGTEGIEKAANYLKAELIKIGVKPLADNYFQNFDIMVDIKAGDNNKFSFDETSGRLNEDFIPLAISESKSLSAKAVFVGYGFDINEDNLKWNDFAEIDVNGKWVIMFRDAPSGDNNEAFENYKSIRKKVLTARDKGAAGIIFINSKDFDLEDNLISLSFANREASVGIPVINAKRSLINKLLEKYEFTIEDLESAIKESRSAKSFEIESVISATVDLEKINATTKNIVAIIEGSDPILKNEYIIIGAHYDHLGMGGKGSGSRAPDTLAIHNGADDNASGSAAILEIFEKLAANKNQLKRSVIYLAFTAEEMGLIGSKYFTNNPLVDLKKVKFMFNLDMVGRLNPETKNLTVGGTGTAEGLENLIKTYSDKSGLNVKFDSQGYGPSDHASFYAKDIPVMFLFTGIHEDYHTPKDDANLINYEGEKLVADMTYEMILDIANRNEALVYKEAGPKEQKSASRSMKVSLGIMPDVASSDVKGVRADAVIDGKPAQKAGMKKGDVIISIDGKNINDIYDYMNRLSSFKHGDKIQIEVMRGEEKISLTCEL